MSEFNRNSLISKKETREKIRALTDLNSTASVILGAGASFGYSEGAIHKPPIVKDLFNPNNGIVGIILDKKEHKLLKSNRQHYIEELKTYDNDLEAYLSALYHRNSKDNLFSNLVLYLQDIYWFASDNFIDEPNNYKKLINLMWELHGSNRWACISFNYDTLLEKSYIAAGRDPDGRGFDSLESYTDFNPVILKVHGGINFRYDHTQPHNYGDEDRRLPAYSLFSSMMANSSNWKVGVASVAHLDGYVPNHYHRLYPAGQQELSAYDFPLMLIPVHATIETGNPFFKKMIALAVEEIKRSKLIISIGYNFGDHAFTEKLSGLNFAGKEVILVTTVDDIQNCLASQRLKKICPLANIRIFEGDGFTEFVRAM